MKSARPALAAVVAVSASMLLAACGDAVTSGATSSTANAAASSSGAAAAKSKTLAFIPPAFTSPFHVAVKNGAAKIAQADGYTLDAVAAQQETDFAQQVSLTEQEISKGVAGIAITPIDPKAVLGALKKANTANIPVVVPNNITPIDGAKIAQYIGYDQWGGAKKLGEYACKLLNGQGDVYILRGSPSFYANRRTDGFIDGLKACPGVKVVGQQAADWVRDKAITVATAALQKYPNIKLFYGNSDEMSIGAGIAAKKAGKTIGKDIFNVGIDGNAVTLDLIAKGDVTATLGVYPDKIGETAINSLQDIIGGKTVPQVLQTPSTVVDKANLDAYKAGTTWTAPQGGNPELDNGKPTNG